MQLLHYLLLIRKGKGPYQTIFTAQYRKTWDYKKIEQSRRMKKMRNSEVEDFPCEKTEYPKNERLTPIQSYNIKFMNQSRATTFLVTILLIVSVFSGNLAEVSQDIEEQAANKGSTFSNMFGMFKEASAQQEDRKKTIEELDLVRKIFKGAQNAGKAQKIMNGTDGLNPVVLDTLTNLPKGYIPRRKHSKQIKKGDHKQKNSKANFQLLNEILKAGLSSSAAGKDKMIWQNPAFIANGNQLPFYKIFGKKHQGKNKHPHLSQEKIQELIQQKVPFLNQGHIIGMESNNYRNGIMLKIDYENPEENGNQVMYSITARYKPKRNHIEIISFKENNPESDDTSENKENKYENPQENKQYQRKVENEPDFTRDGINPNDKVNDKEENEHKPLLFSEKTPEIQIQDKVEETKHIENVEFVEKQRQQEKKEATPLPQEIKEKQNEKPEEPNLQLNKQKTAA